MPSVFSLIIAGDLPGRFVWEDDLCVAFLTINPLTTGHTLVVTRAEVEHWLDLDRATRDHVFDVAHTVGRAIQAAWSPEKVGLLIAGLEVPHVHLHVAPVWTMADLDFANVDHDPDPGELDAAAETIRGALRDLGATQVVGPDRSPG